MCVCISLDISVSKQVASIFFQNFNLHHKKIPRNRGHDALPSVTNGVITTVPGAWNVEHWVIVFRRAA